MSLMTFQLTAARRRLGTKVSYNPIKFEFQLTAARRRLAQRIRRVVFHIHFNSQPREGGWHSFKSPLFECFPFQLTAARRRLGHAADMLADLPAISTHSRAKAAGRNQAKAHLSLNHFNSQPREGGWSAPPRAPPFTCISTHSRAKAAGLTVMPS